ncbi:MAG: hypothetical protein ACOY8P_08695 [Thermodesulfobacteriota bacterium]
MASASQNATAIWSRQKAKDTAETDQGNLTYSVSLQQEATDAISLNEALRYLRTHEEDRETEFIDPSLRFSVRNDFFLFDALGSASERRDSTAADRSKQSWETTLTSGWQRRFWPKIRLSHAEDYDQDDEVVHLTDQRNVRENGSVEWDFELFRTYYSYNRTRDSDFVQESEDDTTNHFGRLETSGNLLQNRLRYGFSQQFSQNTNTYVTALGGGGTADIEQTISSARTAHDDNPTDSSVPTYTAVPAAFLDGVTDVASGVESNANLADEDLNIELNIALNVVVNKIYLYTKASESSRAAQFHFAIYTSSSLTPTGSDWQPLIGFTDYVPTYNAVQRRFEFSGFSLAGTNVKWIKLVLKPTSFLSPVAEFTEMEIYKQVTGAAGSSFSESSRTTTHLTDFNTGMKLTETTDLSYIVSQERGDYSSGTTYSRRSQAATFRWAPWQFLTSSLEMGETRERSGTSPETMSRRYGANLIALPLPTVDTTLNVSRTDQYEGGWLKSVSHDTGLFTTAALYPDLNSSLDLTFRRRHDMATDLLNREYGSRLVFTARLIPNVTADLTGDYLRNEERNAPESFESALVVNWRASDLLSVNTALRKKWQDWQRESESMQAGFALAPTEQLQFNFSVEYLNSEATSNRYFGYATWEIGPFFTLQFDANYGKQSGVEDWQARGQFIARFAGD